MATRQADGKHKEATGPSGHQPQPIGVPHRLPRFEYSRGAAPLLTKHVRCRQVEERSECRRTRLLSPLEAAGGMAVGCGADNRRALAFRTVRTLRRSKRESADSRKEIYANPTPLCRLDPA